MRARSPDRRDRRAPDNHAPPCAATPRLETRHSLAMHRRLRGCLDRHRNHALTSHMQLKHNVVAVTGGVSSIGKAIATGVISRGAIIALLDLNPSDLESIRAQLESGGARVTTA